MPSTLNPACPLCGLRFTNSALLELHIREDHLQRRARPADPGHGDSGDIKTSQARAGPPPSRSAPQPASQTAAEVITATVTQQSRPQRRRTILSRVASTIRHVNDELLRASEAMIRSRRAPRPAPDASADTPQARPEDAQAAPRATPSAGRGQAGGSE